MADLADLIKDEQSKRQLWDFVQAAAKEESFLTMTEIIDVPTVGEIVFHAFTIDTGNNPKSVRLKAHMLKHSEECDDCRELEENA